MDSRHQMDNSKLVERQTNTSPCEISDRGGISMEEYFAGVNLEPTHKPRPESKRNNQLEELLLLKTLLEHLKPCSRRRYKFCLFPGRKPLAFCKKSPKVQRKQRTSPVVNDNDKRSTFGEIGTHPSNSTSASSKATDATQSQPVKRPRSGRVRRTPVHLDDYVT